MQLSGRYGEEAVKDRNIVKFNKKGIITAKSYRITEEEINKQVEQRKQAELVARLRAKYRLDPNVKLYLRNGKESELPQVNGTPVFYVVNGSLSYKQDKRNLSFLF